MTTYKIKECGCELQKSERKRVDGGYHTKLGTKFCQKHLEQITTAMDMMRATLSKSRRAA